jgi:hypothetical protein
MVNEIITIFYICDEYLKSIGHKDDKQARISTSEVITITIVAGKFFGGNYERSRWFLLSHGYIKTISKSRMIRRFNAVPIEILQGFFAIMAQSFKLTNTDGDYILDSFPVPVCANIRIKRCKIYRNEMYRGFSATRDDYFFGIRVHMLVTKSGQPVEFFIEPGSFSDIKVARSFRFNIPKKSKIHADKGYTDYGFEDHLELSRQIHLLAVRKDNAKRKDRGVSKKIRKMVETTFSSITSLFGRKIHAITAFGFERKVIMFIFAYCMKFKVAT